MKKVIITLVVALTFAATATRGIFTRTSQSFFQKSARLPTPKSMNAKQITWECISRPPQVGTFQKMQFDLVVADQQVGAAVRALPTVREIT